MERSEKECIREQLLGKTGMFKMAEEMRLGFAGHGHSHASGVKEAGPWHTAKKNDRNQ